MLNFITFKHYFQQKQRPYLLESIPTDLLTLPIILHAIEIPNSLIQVILNDVFSLQFLNSFEYDLNGFSNNCFQNRGFVMVRLTG
jgi:hypothetical protein